MTNKSSTDHYDEAEKLLEEAESHREPDTRAEWCLELARMHLALSQASTAARALDLGEKASAGPSSPDKTPRIDPIDRSGRAYKGGVLGMNVKEPDPEED